MLTSLFPTSTPFPRPTHAHILAIVSPKSMLKMAKRHNEREWQNELDK
jgi:hypothetical protein